jgi:hypothetical protein
VLPFLIRLRLLIVNWPIDFDCQAMLRAVEVEDVRPNRVLAPELLPCDSAIPDASPEDRL